MRGGGLSPAEWHPRQGGRKPALQASVLALPTPSAAPGSRCQGWGGRWARAGQAPGRLRPLTGWGAGVRSPTGASRRQRAPSAAASGRGGTASPVVSRGPVLPPLASEQEASEVDEGGGPGGLFSGAGIPEPGPLHVQPPSRPTAAVASPSPAREPWIFVSVMGVEASPAQLLSVTSSGLSRKTHRGDTAQPGAHHPPPHLCPQPPASATVSPGTPGSDL